MKALKFLVGLAVRGLTSAGIIDINSCGKGRLE